MSDERLDPITAQREGRRCQAVAARVLHKYATPEVRKEAVLQRDRERVIAHLSQSRDAEFVAESNESKEVTYYCTGCCSTIERERVSWHRMHGRLSEIH